MNNIYHVFVNPENHRLINEKSDPKALFYFFHFTKTLISLVSWPPDYFAADTPPLED